MNTLRHAVALALVCAIVEPNTACHSHMCTHATVELPVSS